MNYMINYKDFWYNVDENVRPPLAVRVAEARLVDGMIPLSKFTSGKTGKSVPRSYLSTLDLMVPVEASVSGAISGDSPALVDEGLRTVRDRYDKAMDYLKSPDDTAGADGRSKLATYVAKQALWSEAVQRYSFEQNEHLKSVKPPPGATKEQVKEARELHLQWIQEHGRDFKHAIQARYMDWVVHGYKFMIDFNFGIVDISSGMKRIENSKEAFRNLTLIADDGVSEYSSVILTPSHWATIVKDKVVNWEQKHGKPSASELRAEIRRLNNLLASHKTLLEGVENQAFFPIIHEQRNDGDAALQTAYANVYASMDDKTNAKVRGTKPTPEARTKWLGQQAQPADGAPKEDPFQALVAAQQKWNDDSLDRNKAVTRSSAEADMKTAASWLTGKVDSIKAEIELLMKQLGGEEGKMTPMPVVDEKGVVITDEDRAADPALVNRPVPKEANEWTRVSCKASRSSELKETSTFESASSVAAKVGWGLFRASGGASHTRSSAKAMSSMSNLEVEMTMDCMVVEIERPWLHAELFSDADLDSGTFNISPGETQLKTLYEQDRTPTGPHQQFSAYPTAMVVASDIELSFSGDTTHLESAVSASSTQVNLSVGYGPFSISGSHKQSKSNSKTKMESTATGCKISIQAPQIVGWVQTLMPQLPKPKNAPSKMVGLFNK
ncbi:hypothetical protein ACHAPT_012996 [Fusarium lateritium]